MLPDCNDMIDCPFCGMERPEGDENCPQCDRMASLGDYEARIAELEQALAEMQVYCAQQLAPEIARREIAEKHIAELEAMVAELDAERDRWKGIIDHLREAGVIT